nr:hypothetical protein [uncultured Blautia sp.]
MNKKKTRKKQAPEAPKEIKKDLKRKSISFSKIYQFLMGSGAFHLQS